MMDFRYLKPGYVALNVTNLDRSIAFYCDLVGLHLEERVGDQLACLRCSDDHHNVLLYRAPSAGIRRMAFQLESPEDLTRAHSHIRKLGWPLTEVAATEIAALRQGKTLRFALPHSGLTFEFYAEIAPGRDRYIPTLTQIQRLGHVVIRCANRDAVLDTLTRELNFRVSDYFGDQVAFLRCHPNPYHHSFGVSRAESDGLHHVNFMVRDVDDIGRAMNRMRNAGVEIVYGPGRHDISNSIFLYYLDPDGMTVEFSFGMEEFPEAQPREPRKLPPLPEILDAWGGLPGAAFGKTGALDTSPHATGEA